MHRDLPFSPKIKIHSGEKNIVYHGQFNLFTLTVII